MQATVVVDEQLKVTSECTGQIGIGYKKSGATK